MNKRVFGAKADQIKGTSPNGTSRNLYVTMLDDQLRIAVFTDTKDQSGYDIDIDPKRLLRRLRRLGLID